ncbi:amino acid transporter AVT1J-like isoform X1 [Centruroides sculpturatus]|uniref:amino acid transporter AVT1J-like isoform X1 n=1 Tax=Centruroides sculpturatus TaxID=218467 RepID=UPI000C6EA22C|nr:amino acid transporter AVT1J-like isoform X1 [Centruroides sculpturatus]
MTSTNKRENFWGLRWPLSMPNFLKKSEFDYETVPLWQQSTPVDVQDGEKKKKGLSFWKATIFVAGEMAGSGVLALPEAVSNIGWIGILIIIVCCVNAGYAGVCLGRCWLILEERWPEYRMRMRYPYPAIAYRATCTCMRYVVSFCVDFTLIGVSTVFLLLCSQLVQQLVCSLYDLSFCFWILIIAAILCPLMWLGTPSDFWPAAVGAFASTAIACVLLIINILSEKSKVQPPKYKIATLESFFLGFGTVAFAFGGASTFPTFQNDMEKKELFPKCVLVAFSILLLLYIPVSACGYHVFGSSVHPDILLSLEDNPLKMTVEILLAAHLFFAFLIVVNPPAQELEEFFKVPRSFNWKRIVLRTSVMGVVVFIAESIPHFGKILNFVGGSTVTLMTFVFPPIFYMRLCDQRHPKWPKRTISLHERVYLIEVMLIGIVAGVISSYSALNDIFKPDAFTLPCYINLTAASSGNSCGH